MKKKSFIFNVAWQEILLEYPAEVRLEVYDAVIRYAASGIRSELKPMAKMAFSFIKNEIDYNAEKYDDIVQKRSEAGKKGMENRYGNKLTNLTKANKSNKSYQNYQKVTNVTDNDNDNAISSPTSVVEDIDTLPPNSKEFVPPSLDDMCKYFDEKGYTREAAERAYNYYTEQNWKDSKGKQVKNWKSKCIAVWFKPENKKSDCPQRPWGDHGIAL